MSYHHFTTYERGKLEELLLLGYSIRQIARRLERHHSSIAREISRNSPESGYSPEQAQHNYELRRQQAKPKGKITTQLIELISEKLLATWSPEQIANTIMLGKVSFKTIYTWLYAGLLPKVDSSNLRHKGKRKNKDSRGMFSMGMPISQRPEDVQTRQSFGHWELDTVVSSRGKSKGCIATFIERKSRLYTAFLMKDRTADSMMTAIAKLRNLLPSAAFKTGTTDRGKEVACFHQVKKELDIDLYFADAYCSWQRGSNENANGLLREFYPKKTDFALVDQHELTEKLLLINSRPRKCLGWNSPIHVFLHELSHLT